MNAIRKKIHSTSNAMLFFFSILGNENHDKINKA